jgi:hypothetical protein
MCHCHNHLTVLLRLTICHCRPLRRSALAVSLELGEAPTGSWSLAQRHLLGRPGGPTILFLVLGPPPFPKPKTRRAACLKGFWLRDLPRDSIHHDSPEVFPYNIIIWPSQTSKEGFLSVNGLPREYHGHYTKHGNPIMVDLNPTILVRHVQRMRSAHWSATSTVEPALSTAPHLHSLITLQTSTLSSLSTPPLSHHSPNLHSLITLQTSTLSSLSTPPLSHHSTHLHSLITLQTSTLSSLSKPPDSHFSPLPLITLQASTYFHSKPSSHFQSQEVISDQSPGLTLPVREMSTLDKQ